MQMLIKSTAWVHLDWCYLQLLYLFGKYLKSRFSWNGILFINAAACYCLPSQNAQDELSKIKDKLILTS